MPNRQRGAFLVEGLVALALVGLLAAGGAALAHAAAQFAREAARVDLALAAGEQVLARLDGTSYTRLPVVFGAPLSALTARIDTAAGTAPSDWAPLCDELPGCVIEAQLDGLGEGGVPLAFADASVLALVVRVRWSEGGRTRDVELADVRT